MCKAKDNIVSPKAKHSKEHYNTIHGNSYMGYKDVQPSPLDFFPFPWIINSWIFCEYSID